MNDASTQNPRGRFEDAARLEGAASSAPTNERTYHPDRDRKLAGLLMALTALFAMRVSGQILVALGLADGLPAFEQWQSGLLPYPALLASQAAILGLMATLEWQLWRGHGWLVAPRPRLAVWLRRFSYLYAGSMVVRYALTMALMPEWRWFGHSIPTLFHCVLAGWLFVYALVLTGPGVSKERVVSGRRKRIQTTSW
jgi:hypothetical protein